MRDLLILMASSVASYYLICAINANINKSTTVTASNS